MILIGVFCWFLSGAAFAGLGGDAASVQSDARHFGGQVRVSRQTQYVLHEISRDWLRVHEFADGGGKVFALAWRGRQHPDLQTLLNGRLADFQLAVAQARKGQRHGQRHGGVLAATVGNLHVELGGHMGAIYGRVWFTDQLPAGMDLHEIK